MTPVNGYATHSIRISQWLATLGFDRIAIPRGTCVPVVGVRVVTGLAPKWWTVASAPDVAPFSAEFRHPAVLLTRSKGVPVTHVARELGIRIDSLRDWIAQARHDPRQLHEGTLCETVQAELVRLRADNRLLLREIAILRDALRIVASEGISAERGRR